MRVITLNVKSNPVMPTAFARADITRALELGEVILLQEIAPEAYRGIIKGLSPDRWGYANLNLEVPIVWRADLYEPVGAGGHILTSKGREHVSPNRYFSWVALRRRDTGTVVVFCNTHRVSGGYSHPGQLGDADGWRIETWEEEEAADVAQIAKFVDAGQTVVGGGDYNRAHMPKLHPDMEWLSPTGGFDYLWYIEGSEGPTVQVYDTDTISRGWHTDHPARRARLYFHARDVKPTPPTPPAPPVPVDPESLAAALALVEASLGRKSNDDTPILSRIEALIP